MKIFIFLFFTIVSSLFSQELYNFKEAEVYCKSKGKTLPTISELIKIKSILGDGVFWSKSQTKQNGNFEYWVLIRKGSDFQKGILDENIDASFVCVKKKKSILDYFDRTKAQQKFTQIYKDNVVIFPIGYLSFLGTPVHTITKDIYPYNFYNFEIQMKEAVLEKDMKYLVGKIVAYDTILFGKVLSVKKIDKYGYEYRFLTTPADMTEPYILPDEAIH